MPRKTKKQKLLVELHRKQTVVNYTFKETTYQPQKPEKMETVIGSNSLPYIIADLKKTLILTTLAILFVLVLYLGWH